MYNYEKRGGNMNCQKCGTQMNEDDKFCPVCGAAQVASQARQSFCPSCGGVVGDDETFCSQCDAQITANPPQTFNTYPAPENRRNNNTAIIIAIVSVLVVAVMALAAVLIINSNSSKDAEEIDDPYTEQEMVEEDEEPAPPVFGWVSASSTRGYDTDTSTGEVVNYYPEYAVDGDMRTAWTPDRNRESQPTITLNSNDMQYVTGIRMTNGYCKSERTYTKNCRITRALIEYNGGSKEAMFGINNYRNMLEVTFDEPVYTDHISITVLETYYGDWKDTAISEIEVF